MFFRSIVAAAAAVVVGTPATAQSALQALSTGARDTLATAFVTATRLAAATVAPTATTTVLRGDDLRAQGITRVADALRLVPGTTIVSSGSLGSQTSLFMRGGNSSYVRVLVDGVPLNDAGGFIDLANFTTDNIDRIEVVRGPASVLYGSEAITGVIQLFTRSGAGPASWRALVGGGTQGTRRAELSLSGGHDAIRYSLMGAHHTTNGILAFNNGFTTGVLSGVLRVTPDARTDVQLAGRWSAASFHFPTDYTGAIGDRNAEQADHRLTISADAGRRVSRRIEVRALLTSNEFLPRSNDGPDTPADTVGFYGFFSRSTRTRRAADIRANMRLAARSTLTVGAEFARDRERSTSVSLSEFGPSAGSFDGARHNTGLYAQAVGDATDRVSYSVGARRDGNSAFGVFTTSRIGVAWLAGSSARVRAAVGTAFKAPSFFENFATGYVTGNPALRPEQSRSIEVGFDAFRMGGRMTLSGALFHQQFRDIIQYSGTAPAPGAPNYFNLAGADAKGMDLSASVRVNARVTFSTSYSWTDTRVTEAGFDSTHGASYVNGERLIRRPPHTVTATAAWRNTVDDNLRITATRVGARADRDFAAYPVTAITMPAYVKVDASARVRVSPRNALALVVRVDNLLSARYEEVARFQAPTRTVFVGLRFGR